MPEDIGNEKEKTEEVLENPFKINIKGKECLIKVDDDPPWGKVQEILDKCVIVSESGLQKFDMNNFMDLLLETVIIDGLPFNGGAKNRTEMKSLKSSEATLLIGEVKKRIPLGTYLSNLEMGGSLLGR